MDMLGRTHDVSRVFNDLLTMSICGFHRTNIQSRLHEQDKFNEALYMDTIKRYNKEELKMFAKSLATLQLSVYDNPYSDVLGEYFTQNITRGQNGQFFTPEHICELMTKMQGEKDTSEGNKVLDPACGSGRMLLRFAKHNPNNFFYGADVSDTCAKMTTINFFLNGLRGEVACMNSLSMEWFSGWQINTHGIGIIPIEKEQSRIWSRAPRPQENTDRKQGVSRGQIQTSQLELF